MLFGFSKNLNQLWITVANLRPKQLNTIIRFMAMFSNILRSGVTLQPAFMLANLWRGKIDAYVKAGSDLSIRNGGSCLFRQRS